MDDTLGPIEKKELIGTLFGHQGGRKYILLFYIVYKIALYCPKIVFLDIILIFLKELPNLNFVEPPRRPELLDRSKHVS